MLNDYFERRIVEERRRETADRWIEHERRGMQPPQPARREQGGLRLALGSALLRAGIALLGEQEAGLFRDRGAQR